VEGQRSGLGAGAVEAGDDGLSDRSELPGREAYERDAGAGRVARAARSITITVEGGAIGTLEAVVFADDPFLHAGTFSLDHMGRCGWHTSRRCRCGAPPARE